MFFSINTQQQTNFSDFFILGGFCVSTDSGWKTAKIGNIDCVYKGYVDHMPLQAALGQITAADQPTMLGNFCVLMYDPETASIKIKTDRYRSFPIWWDSTGVTNLDPKPNTAWADSLLEIDTNFAVSESKFDVIGHIDTSPVTVDQLIEFVDQRLGEKTQRFLQHNQLPVRVFLSGGVDTALVYSYLQKYTSDYELLKCNLIEYDKFWLNNGYDIQHRFWGYGQIHHWCDPCVLTSGAPGDEFMLRSPVTADLFLKYQRLHITDLLEQRTWLHSAYFNKPKHLEIFHQQTVNRDLDRVQFYWNLCNTVVNDWQHWHLGQTLTWTPLRDLEIFKMFLRLPAEQAIGQIMDSTVSIALIERNKPGLSKIISDQKNTGNAMRNLVDFLFE